MEPPNPAVSGKVIAPPASAVTSHTVNPLSEGDYPYDQTMKMKVPGTGMTVFNRYKLERILGRGGMGVVWLADDMKLERPVALKFLPSLIGLDPAAVRELKIETRRGLELSHPHIVRIYDFVDDEDAAAISMEFVDGKTLSELRLGTEHGVFTVEQISRWLPGVCDALDYAHFQRKVVHRDLKPANIMLTTKDEVAKVADFGIARSLSDTMSRLSAAHIGTSGTLPYMSPQQAMGDRPLPTDDVYSLGATLYELLAGKPPFYRGDLSTQINSKIAPLMGERRQELEISASDAIPKEWEEAIAACLHKDPNMRPSCAGMLAEMLHLKPHNGTARTLNYPKFALNRAPATKSKMPLLAAAAALVIAGGAVWHFSNQKPANVTDPGAGAASTKAGEEEHPAVVLGPKTPVIDTKPVVAEAPMAPLPATTRPAGSDPAPRTPPASTAPTATPLVAAAATVSAPPTLGGMPTSPNVPVVAPNSPALAPGGTLPAPAVGATAPGIISPMPAASGFGVGPAMPLTPDATPTVVAASTPPPGLPGTPAVATFPGAAPGVAPQLVRLPPTIIEPDGELIPGAVIPMPAQPIVTDPTSGFWPVDQIYPSLPYSTYSPMGKKYLLYRTQTVLKERGLYTSTVDGKEGKGTHNAIQLFQAKGGLRPNGLLDIPTLAALQLTTELDNPSWEPPAEGSSSSGPRRAPGGGRYGRQAEEEPGFFERTGGKIKGLFK